MKLPDCEFRDTKDKCRNPVMSYDLCEWWLLCEMCPEGWR